ncbi:MAG: thiamine pyrophosphate-dependent enzyme [Bacteroidota bacterium]
MNTPLKNTLSKRVSFLTKEEVIQDYRLGYKSRIVSILGRREVLTGKAKFGIFGDGKEVAQLALAKAFKPGDFRSGYYRDQTLGFKLGLVDIKSFFAQLYAHADVAADPHSAGRQMNTHMASRLLDEQGNWLSQTDKYLTSADGSSTASQMPRLVGLAQASKLYRDIKELSHMTDFSIGGNEIAFGTIGNGACAEGHFWETVNAAGVLQVPMVISIWDDGYGISVPNEYQITKSNLSEVLSGFQREEGGTGLEIFSVDGSDYVKLCEVYQYASELARKEHVPCIVHVHGLTQPQGHSTSGSHERYKTEERLSWEKENDCLKVMRSWIISEGYATEEEILKWEDEDKKYVRKLKVETWKAYQKPIQEEFNICMSLIEALKAESVHGPALQKIIDQAKRSGEVNRREYMEAAYKALLTTRSESHLPAARKLKNWRQRQHVKMEGVYDSLLMNDTHESPQLLDTVKPTYEDSKSAINGFEIINAYFDHAFEKDARLVAFGEDMGHLGDVNQGFAGLQKKYGLERIFDTGIREQTIVGQAIGLALRGLRPIAEIQYLDYLIYAVQTLSDDLATLSYRTAGGQKAPVIIRSRGHRLEGIWHAGSPLGMIINSLRGMHVCVPRNMTQAIGMYETLIKGDEPGLVIEVLNAYRQKEVLPTNLGEFRVALGEPEILREGKDITIITYGACIPIAMKAASQLEQVGIDLEIIDVQTLLPFDVHHSIVESLKKTNRIIFMDEDVPGGASAYMMQQVLEEQGGYQYLDSSPHTLTAKDHRCAYGTDGDYWSKPQVEHVYELAYSIMNEADPIEYPTFL